MTLFLLFILFAPILEILFIFSIVPEVILELSLLLINALLNVELFTIILLFLLRFLELDLESILFKPLNDFGLFPKFCAAFVLKFL